MPPKSAARGEYIETVRSPIPSPSTKHSLPITILTITPPLCRTLATKSPVAPSSTAPPTSSSPASPSSSTTSSSAATSCASNPLPLPLPPQPPTQKKRLPTPSLSTSAATSSSPHTARYIRPLASPPPIYQLPPRRRHRQRQRSPFTPPLGLNPLANRRSPISRCGSPISSTLARTPMSMQPRSGVMSVSARIALWATWS